MLPNNMHNSQVISDSEMLDEYSNSSGGDIDASNASSGDEAQTSGVVMEPGGNKISSFFGFKMDYAKTAPNVRDRKLRPSNYDKTTGKTIKPPKGKKTSKSRQYYNPVKVASLIAIFSKPHKVLVRDTSSQNKTKKK